MTDEVKANAVVLDDDGLLIRSLRVLHPAVRVACCKARDEGRNVPDFVVQALAVGVQALDAVASGQDLERLEAVLADVDAKVAESVRSALTNLRLKVQESAQQEAERFDRSTSAALTRLSDGVSALVSGQDGILARNVQASVQRITEETQRSLQEVMVTQAATTQAVLNQDRDQVRAAVLAQLGQQQIELRSAFGEIRERLAALDAARRTRAASPARGDDFEESAHELVSRIAHAAGDLANVEHTGRVTGAKGVKKGDIVVTVQGATRHGAKIAKIAIEAKDRRGTSKVSVRSLTEELREGRSDRGAVCSLGLLPPKAMPLRDHKVVLLEQRSLCVVYEPGGDEELVTAAYQLMKLLAISESPDGSSGLDRRAVRNQLDDLTAALNRFNELEKHAGSADRAVSKIREVSTQLKADLVRRLGELGPRSCRRTSPIRSLASQGTARTSTHPARLRTRREGSSNNWWVRAQPGPTSRS